MASKKKESDTTPITFTGPAGETTIHAYEGMVQDLPPLWTIRYQDLVGAFVDGAVGANEFFAKLTAVMTHLPDVPGNQRVDVRKIDLGALGMEHLQSMAVAGAQLQPFVIPNASDEDGEDDAGGAGKNA